MDFAAFLLQELSEEVYTSVHVDCSDEGNKFEKQLSCLEGEEERAVPEDLLEGVCDAPSYDVVRVLDVLQDIRIQFVVVEYIWVQLAQS